MQSTRNYDRLAMVLGLACIIHCLALPIIALAIPIVSIISEQEWVHAMLAILAVAASASVYFSDPQARRVAFFAPALSGLALVVGALFAEPFGIDETVPTVIGGLLLAIAHGSRLFRGRLA